MSTVDCSSFTIAVCWSVAVFWTYFWWCNLVVNYMKKNVTNLEYSNNVCLFHITMLIWYIRKYADLQCLHACQVHFQEFDLVTVQWSKKKIRRQSCNHKRHLQNRLSIYSQIIYNYNRLTPFRSRNVSRRMHRILFELSSSSCIDDSPWKTWVGKLDIRLP